ncbi:MAG: TetR/AcrR family transcriptional regulator [Coriobacteriia bacterium]|nr:TetR/AcrR family transcriptional regulator [Coriobacteriia bacterium]MCL2746356.1 TetR/AcrR family transcriptional regulator [Coriobacteriia bacterium]MCL2870590.1 TetR/AcrR family transcriptional regulator [Coriobacteriia bacterium]
MPKVSKDYRERKKQEIIAAAIAVCQAKPVYEVTLRDVVKECGISQGSIYNYFSSIDEIFAEIVNHAYGAHQIASQVATIATSEIAPGKKILEILSLMGKLVDVMTTEYGTILYELNGLYTRNPKRATQFTSKVKVSDDTNAALTTIMSIIEEGTARGIFSTDIPKEHFFLLLETSAQGITRAITFIPSPQIIHQLYGIDEDKASAQGMMEILAHLVTSLLEA